MEDQTLLINQWVATDCDPEQIPAFLLAEGLKIGNYNNGTLIKAVERQAAEAAVEFVAKSEVLQNFLADLRQSKEVFEGLTCKSYYYYVNTARLVFSEELQTKLLTQFAVIKEDSRLLAGAVLMVERSFPRLWNYSPGGRYESHPDISAQGQLYSGCECRDERYYKFYMRLNPLIKRLERSGDHSFSSYFVSDFLDSNQEKQSDYTHCAAFHALMSRLSQEGVFQLFGKHFHWSHFFSAVTFLAYGPERSEKLVRNFCQSIEQINTTSAAGYEDRVCDKFCHGQWEEGQKKPAIKDFVEKIRAKQGIAALLRYDADVKHNLLVYLDGRSEYGGSGGVGQIRQVILLCGQERAMQEFTYRDRYSYTNDNYALEFGDVKFVSVKEEGQWLEVQVRATPENTKEYSSRGLSFRIKADYSPAPVGLDPEAQASFLTQLKEQKQAKLEEFREAASHRTGQAMSKDYSGYVPYPDPHFSTPEAVDASLGLAAFVIKECIDHRVTVLQWRYRLFLVSFGQPLQEIAEDHAYESEGDAAICGLSFSGKRLGYTMRSGRKEHLCEVTPQP